jgi:hypothetical protein
VLPVAIKNKNMAEDNDSNTPDVIGKAGSAIGIGEKMGCLLLNLGCLLLILAIASLIAMALDVVNNPLKAISALLGSLWTSLTGGK